MIRFPRRMFCRFVLPVFLLLLASFAEAQLVRQANTTLNLPAGPQATSTYNSENALGSLTFTAPVDVASLPGVTDKLFVIEKAGTVQLVNLAVNPPTKQTFMTLTGVEPSGEQGLLGIAFHPKYNENGYFYLFYSMSGTLYQRVARFRATGTANNYNAATSANFNTMMPIITQRDQNTNHNGGDLAFGPDGYLYISVGDEGAADDSRDNARRISKDFFGAILRIDVDSKSTSLAPNPHDESSTGTVGDSAIGANMYKIPADNPFVALAQGTGNATYNGITFAKTAIRTEIYATGLRNPWRMSFDPQNGRLFVGDVGQGAREEIDIITKGTNAGWSWREGTIGHTAPGSAPEPSGFAPTPPIHDYNRSLGSSVTGGVVYRGNRLQELFGAYIFADFNAGSITALRENANGTWTPSSLGSDGGISGFGYDPRNNDLIYCKLNEGTPNTGLVKRLVRNTTTGTLPPATLTLTGAFSNVPALTPSPGVVPYEPNVSFWSDSATKRRWFSIKNTADKITYNANGNWTFPTGMVWVKHFDVGSTKIETRLLVKTSDGVYGLSYKWRTNQQEADLVNEIGENYLIPSTTQTWRFPSRSECLTCHTAAGGLALSFNTPQLNRAHTYGTTSLNQIAALRDAVSSGGAPLSYFTAASTPGSLASLPAFAAAGDETQSLEWRVRSYLSVNCVQCHQPGGPAVGNWDARHTTKTDMANIINGMLVNDAGDVANRFLVFGDTAHSMLVKRQQGLGVQRMPPLGTLQRDTANETLVANWIAAGTTRQSFMGWQTFHFTSTTAPNSLPDADPDGDGRSNRLEYMTGTDPKSPGSGWTYGTMSVAGNEVQFQFTQPANRAAIVEVSPNLVDWQVWEVPGNTPSYPATAQQRVISVPTTSEMRFFRVGFSEP